MFLLMYHFIFVCKYAKRYWIDDVSKEAAKWTLRQMFDLFEGDRSEKEVVVWYESTYIEHIKPEYWKVNTIIKENTSRPHNSIRSLNLLD